MLNLLYGSALGRMILKILTYPRLSIIAGKFLDSKASRFLIPLFIKKNNISLEEYEGEE